MWIEIRMVTNGTAIENLIQFKVEELRGIGARCW